MTSPVGTTFYSYDAAGRLSSLTNPFGETTTWLYDHAGRVISQSTTTSAGKTIATAYTWGVSGQAGDPSTAPAYLRSITHTINGQVFRSYLLTHSYLGQVLSRQGSGNEFSELVTYTYDQRGRLTGYSRQEQRGTQNFNSSGSYTYDLANNLQGGAGGWTYNTNNQVTAAPPLGGLAGATGLAYDAAGNLTAANGMSFSYDALGNPSTISGTPYGTASFTYDAFGRRTSKTVNGQTTYFLYDGDALIAEADANGNITHAYFWGLLGLISDRVSNLSRFFLFDEQGNTRDVVDPQGVVIGSQSYEPWGGMFAALSPDIPITFKGEQGAYRDKETGLVWDHGSYYAPALGRYTQPAWPGYAGGENPYAVTDPVNGDDDPDAGILPKNWSGENISYDEFRRVVNRGAKLAREGLNVASTFNPLCMAVQVWTGQDATGRKMSQSERISNGLFLAAGPVGSSVKGLKLLSKAPRRLRSIVAYTDEEGYAAESAFREMLEMKGMALRPKPRGNSGGPDAERVGGENLGWLYAELRPNNRNGVKKGGKLVRKRLRNGYQGPIALYGYDHPYPGVFVFRLIGIWE
jgi:RHS repeat-associated protein